MRKLLLCIPTHIHTHTPSHTHTRLHNCSENSWVQAAVAAAVVTAQVKHSWQFVCKQNANAPKGKRERRKRERERGKVREMYPHCVGEITTQHKPLSSAITPQRVHIFLAVTVLPLFVVVVIVAVCYFGHNFAT